MTISVDNDDSLPLRELHRLVGGPCGACDRPLMAREAVGSVALGFKDAPRCLPCLARGLAREAADLRADLVAYAQHRDCYARAWAAAERLDGPSPDWKPLAGFVEPKMNNSPLPPRDAPDPADVWDAGSLGCGELVLALRVRLNALPSRAVLKVTATDPAAPEDLPAWCRLTGHTLVRMEHPDYYIRRKD